MSATDNEINGTVSEIENKKGIGTVFLGSKIPPTPVIPTGVFVVDYALGGGYPEGLAVQLYGYESCGKSLMCLFAIREFQRKYPKMFAVFLDREMTFDPMWAETLGVDLTRLYVSQPEYGEQAVDLLIAFMDTKEVGLIVLDSIPTCTPKGITDESAEKETMGKLAQLMSKMVSHILTSWANQRKRGHKVTLLLVNQWRSKLGLVFGDPRSLPGGRAIQHLVTTKIEMKSKEITGKGEEDTSAMPTHNEHTFVVSKSKTSLAMKEGKFFFVRGEGYETPELMNRVDDYGTVLAFAQRHGLMSGGGTKWSINYGEDKVAGPFGSKKAMINFFIENNHEYECLKKSILMLRRVAHKMTTLPIDGYLVGPEQEKETTKKVAAQKGRKRG